MMYSNLALLLLCSLNVAQAAQVWTVNCDPLSVQRSDPIVSPGVPSGHVHAISSGTAFNRTMLGIDAAVDAAATTPDKYNDHSNYVCVALGLSCASAYVHSGVLNCITEIMACSKLFLIPE